MKNIILFTVSLLTATLIQAQSPVPLLGGNVIKFNVASVATEHYTFQFERSLGLNRSIGLGFGYSNGVELPFKQTLLDQFGDNDDARLAIETTVFDKLTITPEYRFYFSTGAPIGFYLATFIRYTHMNFTNQYAFTPSNGIEHIAYVDGKLDGVGGGAMIGMQWALGKVITLDWWIVGPFIGVQDGSMNGVCDMSDMTAEDKANLESDIEALDIPMWNLDATVGENNIDVLIKGPFYGVRMMGVCIGYRF